MSLLLCLNVDKVRENVADTKRSSGPLYKVPPIDGWWKWKCPVCGSVQCDREQTSVTTCSKGHEVKLAVAGNHGDGWRMCAETCKET